MDSIVDKISDSSNNRDEPFNYFKGTWLPQRFQDEIERIHNFEVRDDDTWVCGIPKSGT